MWAGNKYLLPDKSYIEAPTTKQMGKEEYGYLFIMWLLILKVWLYFQLSQINRNIEEMESNNTKLHFIRKNCRT